MRGKKTTSQAHAADQKKFQVQPKFAQLQKTAEETKVSPAKHGALVAFVSLVSFEAPEDKMKQIVVGVVKSLQEQACFIT